MSRSRLLVAWGVLVLAACGDADETPQGENLVPWTQTVVVHAAPLGGIVTVKDEILFVPRRVDGTLRAAAVGTLRRGGRTEAKSLPLELMAAGDVMGSDSLAWRGLALSDLRDVPHEIVSAAAHVPDFIYLADRRLRVLWWGRVVRAADGRVGSVVLDRAIALGGSDRRDLKKGDPRDHGAGLRALAAPPRAGEWADLYVLDAGSRVPEAWRMFRLDRAGATVQRSLEVRVATGGAPDVRALAFDVDRLLALGAQGQRLQPLSIAEDTARLGGGYPAPSCPAPGGWTHFTIAADGTFVLAVEHEGDVHVALR